MNTQKIEPHRVTKPIQLLAAWLVGLVLIDTLFVVSAWHFEQEWERAALVIASIVNVPLFLAAMFVLQTKFRAELQDDPHYSVYLSKKTSAFVSVERERRVLSNQLEAVATEIPVLAANEQRMMVVGDHAELDWGFWRVALNSHSPFFGDIRKALMDHKIPLAEIFGDAHVPTSEPPSRWVVAINRAMPLEHKLIILKVVSGFRFDGFQFWTPIRDAEETEDVYIGSYGNDSYIRFTQDFDDLLKGRVEEVDLSHYAKINQVS